MKNMETLSLNPAAQEWRPSSQLPSPLIPVIIQPPPFLPPPLIPVIIQRPPPPPFLPPLKLCIPPLYSYVIYPQPQPQAQPIYTSTLPAAAAEEKAAISHEQEIGESSHGHSGRRSHSRRGLPPRLRMDFREESATKPPPKYSAAASVSSKVPVSHPRQKLKKLEWKPKVTANTTVKVSGEAAPSSLPNTTLMIRNIPSKLRRDFMLKFLDRYCKKHSLHYDFFYLPIDFRKLGNLGYCFVNLTTPAAAMKLKKTLTNHKWRTYITEDGEAIFSNKVCEVSWARLQGKEKMIQRYGDSFFDCDDRDFLPVIFEPPRNGSERNPPAPVTLGRTRR